MAITGFELGTDGPVRILVGLDGTDTSMNATAYAMGMARRQHAHLVCLYVRSTTTMASQMAATAGAVIQTQQEIATELRDRFLETAAHRGVSAQFVQRTGNPYRELVAVAHEMKVDAVVVGASMQSGHRLVGSLAGRLVKDAAWPITVVP